MTKPARLLIILFLLLALSPAVSANSERPIYIKSASVETEDSRIAGKVTVCNTERERIRFVLDVKNLTINKIYKRHLLVNASDCVTTDLRFQKDFAEISNIGDEIVMTATQVSGLWSRLKYRTSDTHTTRVVKGKKDYAGCSDQIVKDGIYGACDMDFIYHEPSGLRIKILAHNSDYVQLKLTHVEWGGVKEIRLYKGRSSKIRSNYNQLKRVEITNVYGENTSDLYLKIKS